MKLEIGSGNDPTEGYEHLDINPDAPHVEYVGDIRALITSDYNIESYPDLLRLQWGKFEAIKAVHVIEHVQWIYQDSLLRLFHDLLEPSGALYLETPDLKWIVSSYFKNRRKKRFPTTEHPNLTESGDLLQFCQWVNFKLYSGCSPGDYHCCCYDKTFLIKSLEIAGFKPISIQASRGTLVGIAHRLKVKDKNEEYFNP